MSLVPPSLVLPILPPTGEPAEYNNNYILYWGGVALDYNRLTVSLLNGPNNDPPSASRALAIVHLAIHDAYFAIRPDKSGAFTTYLTTGSSDPNTRLPAVPANGDARLAVAGAAITALRQLYASPRDNVPNNTTIILRQFLDNATTAFPNLNALSPSYAFGNAVGQAILNLLDQGSGVFDQDGYRPTPGRYRFDDDPTNPVRYTPVDINNPTGPQRAVRVYASPFYGFLAKRIAVQKDHRIGDPPVGFGINNMDEYNFAFMEDYNEGGAQALNSTRRKPSQTTTGFFWAYDGANLIGTPPRHYVQLLRKIAVDKKPAANLTDEANNADFARLFALANVAQGEAGIYAWQEKYTFEFWRPLSGIRQDTANPLVDPFWLSLGAPETNTNGIPFKPPFPAYPSGHATFGGAFFQMVRLYYKKRDKLSFADDAPDSIAFTAASDELNGLSRDLRQPYDPRAPLQDQQGTVRTNIVKKFTSLWDAIFDNGISRVFLGVHWGFDAFAPKDVVTSMTIQADGTVAYKAADQIRYQTLGTRQDRPGRLFPLGGVPLGIEIANDIFQSNLKQAATNLGAAGVPAPAPAKPSAQAAEAQPATNGDKTNGDNTLKTQE
ncbi:MAG: hypothetical protein L6R37_003155 [Teloschistes peruensis]|nr:MAG: hypothetical protein L6R37_003155 [Teloschistes peruensis]